MSRADLHLGRGWRFPVAPRAGAAAPAAPALPAPPAAPGLGGGVVRGALRYEEGAEKVRQALWIILDTEPGERVMRPTFGCGLRRFLMHPNTVATRAQIQREAQAAIARWEPRVSLSGVAVEEGDDPALVLIHVSYSHVRDGRPGNLVYPFYLE